MIGETFSVLKVNGEIAITYIDTSSVYYVVKKGYELIMKKAERKQ